MPQLMEARVPDIGSDKGVPVIELLVQVGDRVALDQGLVTLESDKATMEVPSSVAGIVRELAVKVGDEINTGAVVAMIEVEGAAEAATPAAATAAPAAAPVAPAAPVAAPAPARAEPAVAAAHPAPAAERHRHAQPGAGRPGGRAARVCD